MSWSSSCSPLWRYDSHRRHIKYIEIFPHSSCPTSLFPLIWPSSLSSDLPEAVWVLGSTPGNPCVPHIDSIGNPCITAERQGEGSQGLLWGFVSSFHHDSSLSGLHSLIFYLSKPYHFEGSLFGDLHVLLLPHWSLYCVCYVGWPRSLGQLGGLTDKQEAGLEVGLGLGWGDASKI